MLTAFDVGVGVLVLISAILATARGLTREVLSLATWAGSAAFAIYMWQFQPQIARGFIDDTMVADIATVALSFIGALIILHLITMRIADFVVDSRIGPLDRTLGFVFGAARGVLIAVVLVIFGQWVLEPLPDWAAEAKTLPILQQFATGLVDLLPDDLEQQFTGIIEGNGFGGGADQGAPLEAAPPEGADQGEDGSPQV